MGSDTHPGIHARPHGQPGRILASSLQTENGRPTDSGRVVRPRGRYASLTRRVVAANAAVLTAVAVITVLVFSPGDVSSPVALKELAILAGALVVMGLLNLALMRRLLAPIEHLRDFVRTVGPAPAQPARAGRGGGHRGERARRWRSTRCSSGSSTSAWTALAGRSTRRSRSVCAWLRSCTTRSGQSLTAVLLQLARLAKGLPESDSSVLADTQETARESLQEVRRISALAAARGARRSRLGERAPGPGGAHQGAGLLADGDKLEHELPRLDATGARHLPGRTGGAHADVVRRCGASDGLARRGRRSGSLVLTVRDDSVGVGDAPEGSRGPRHARARRLIGARLELGRPRGRRGGGVRAGAAARQPRIDRPAPHCPMRRPRRSWPR